MVSYLLYAFATIALVCIVLDTLLSSEEKSKLKTKTEAALNRLHDLGSGAIAGVLDQPRVWLALAALLDIVAVFWVIGVPLQSILSSPANQKVAFFLNCIPVVFGLWLLIHEPTRRWLSVLLISLAVAVFWGASFFLLGTALPPTTNAVIFGVPILLHIVYLPACMIVCLGFVLLGSVLYRLLSFVERMNTFEKGILAATAIIMAAFATYLGFLKGT